MRKIRNPRDSRIICLPVAPCALRTVQPHMVCSSPEEYSEHHREVLADIRNKLNRLERQ
jgi:hypothetical protein